MTGLTSKQTEVLRFVQGYTEANDGISPALYEICSAMRTSIGTVHRHMECLRERGYISWLPHHARSINVLRLKTIPRGPAGEPLFAVALPS